MVMQVLLSTVSTASYPPLGGLECWASPRLSVLHGEFLIDASLVSPVHYEAHKPCCFQTPIGCFFMNYVDSSAFKQSAPAIMFTKHVAKEVQEKTRGTEKTKAK